MTNSAAIGYCIIAAKELGLDKRTVDALENAMRRAMDEHSPLKAEEAYRNN